MKIRLHGVSFDVIWVVVLVAVASASIAATNSKPPPQYDYVEYPFVSSGSAEHYSSRSPHALADDGVLVTRYKVGDEFVIRHNPAFIATYGLTAYRDFVEGGNPADKERLLTQAEWLMANAVAHTDEEGEYLVWPYDFDNDVFLAKAPWISGFAQGRILVALYYAFLATGEDKYLEGTFKAFRTFKMQMPDGGVATREGDGTWYEEVAGVEVPSSRILNGHNAAVAALWVLAQATEREDARRAFERGVAAVRNELPRYDAQFLSYYSQFPDNPKRLAGTRGYNTLHVVQLLWLYDISGDPVFLEYAIRFARFEDRDISIEVSGSTNAKTHGPENLRFTMGNRYWSNNVFPTWLEVDLNGEYAVHGVLMHAHTPAAAPRDFRVFAQGGEASGWEAVAEVLGNEQQLIRVEFDRRNARRMRIEIDADNGNRNVALDGVAVLRELGNPVAVSNHRTYSIRNRPSTVFDGGWNMPESGWIQADLGARTGQPVSFRVQPALPDGAELRFAAGNGFDAREPLRWERSDVDGRTEIDVDADGMRHLRFDFSGIPRGSTLTVEIGD